MTYPLMVGSFLPSGTSQEQSHVSAYVHQHTTLLTQALAWVQNQRKTRYLLVGKERQVAETWLHTRFPIGEAGM
jgi:hypothetical protein